MDTEQLWSEIRNVRNELLAEIRDLRASCTLLSEKLRVLEAARENSQLRNNALPGWMIATAGVLVSIVSMFVTLYLAGRIP